MKYFILSDIHGSSYYFSKAMEQYDKMKADKLIILGDLLYHGPRNDLPYGHDVKKLVNLLNERKDDIIAIKGNCDAEVDQMVLNFTLHDNVLLKIGDKTLYLTHGHHLKDIHGLEKDTIILYGHTHVPRCEKVDDFYYVNPGSISLPKEDSKHSFLVYEDNIFYLYDLDGNLLNSYKV